MSRIASRAWSGAPDLDLMIDFARASTAARWPSSTYMKVGDVVWALYPRPEFDSSANLLLWFDGGKLAAYASFEPPMRLDFDIRPGCQHHDAIAGEILRWAESRRRSLVRLGGEAIPKTLAMLASGSVFATALESDARRIAFLEQHGYQKKTDHFDVLYSQSLTGNPIAAPKLDPTLRLRHATDDDLDARVDVHRDAWSVWGPSRATVENYRRLRAAPLYDPELDVVLEETAAHRFLSYCIGWLDTANRIGHFEPVGCRPAFTGRGYARAVTIEAMRRMQARGMHTALVGTASINQRARLLYPACGFAEVDRAYFYVKPLGA